MIPPRLIVVGTGTGVGKTFVSVEILKAARAAGLRVAGCKPVESGVTDVAATDGSALEQASGLFHVKQPPYLLARPISPHLAAREAGQRIDPGVIAAWVQDAGGADGTLVETAGGLFSPLGPGLTNLHVIRALPGARVLVVAPDRLGVLHDVTATLAAAVASRLVIGGVVLASPGAADASSGTNEAELRALGIADPLGCFPRGEGKAAHATALASRLLGWWRQG